MDKNIRVGLIVPSPNVVIEPEYYSMHFKGISFYTSRVLGNICTPKNLQTMSEYVERAALELSSARVDVLLYACTAASMLNGIEWEKDLIKRINEISQVPAISTAGSVVKALHFMQIHKVNMFTPYIYEINTAEKNFLSQSGIDVIKMEGLGITKSVEIADVEPGAIFDKVVKMDRNNPDSQGIFISCTNFQTFKIIDKLEKKLMKPVITSNQASLWNLLKMVQFNESVNGLGHLFK